MTKQMVERREHSRSEFGQSHSSSERGALQRDSRFTIHVSSGFGLLEVMISTGILALVAGATVALATSSLRNSTYSANRTAALYLAQAGVEQLRQMRDTTFVDQDGTGNRWLSLFGSDCLSTLAQVQTGQSVSCVLDSQVVNNPSLGGGKSTTFKLTRPTQPTDGQIALSAGASGATTTFTRTIQLRPIDWYDAGRVKTGVTGGVPNVPGDSSTDRSSTLILQVVSTVTWDERGSQRSVTSSSFLGDWRAVQ